MAVEYCGADAAACSLTPLVMLGLAYVADDVGVGCVDG